MRYKEGDMESLQRFCSSQTWGGEFKFGQDSFRSQIGQFRIARSRVWPKGGPARGLASLADVLLARHAIFSLRWGEKIAWRAKRTSAEEATRGLALALQASFSYYQVCVLKRECQTRENFTDLAGTRASSPAFAYASSDARVDVWKPETSALRETISDSISKSQRSFGCSKNTQGFKAKHLFWEYTASFKVSCLSVEHVPLQSLQLEALCFYNDSERL